MGKSVQYLRDVIDAQRTHLPSLVVNWQGILARSMLPRKQHVPIGTFQILVEASISMRLSNCMSEAHRIEVDTRVHEYETRLHEYETRFSAAYIYGNQQYELLFKSIYKEVRDMVTQNVQLYCEVINATTTILTQILPRSNVDVIQLVLDFL